MSDGAQRLPYCVLKQRAGAQVQGQVKVLALFGEIFIKLVCGKAQQRVARGAWVPAEVGQVRLVGEPGANQRDIGGGERHWAERAGVGRLDSVQWKFHDF